MVKKVITNLNCILDCLKVSSTVTVFKNVGERSNTKNYCPLSLLSVVSKVFEKFMNKGLLIATRYVVSFLISSLVSVLLDQLHVF